jgi:hypothetical protein
VHCAFSASAVANPLLRRATEQYFSSKVRTPTTAFSARQRVASAIALHRHISDQNNKNAGKFLRDSLYNFLCDRTCSAHPSQPPATQPTSQSRFISKVRSPCSVQEA